MLSAIYCEEQAAEFIRARGAAIARPFTDALKSCRDRRKAAIMKARKAIGE